MIEIGRLKFQSTNLVFVITIDIAPKSTEIKADWTEANLYCSFLEIDGHRDWRLPTLEELTQIYNSEHDFIDSYYWSAVEVDGWGAWKQGMLHGNQGYNSKDSSSYVRAVRSLS
jgi:hypothetical protein